MMTDFYKILWKSYKIIFLVKLLFLFSNNETEKFENWYGQCFEPMTPPPISPEELLPSLLVYRYFSILVLLWEYSIITFGKQAKYFKWSIKVLRQKFAKNLFFYTLHLNFLHQSQMWQCERANFIRQLQLDYYKVKPKREN